MRRGASTPILLLVVVGLLAALGGTSASASSADDYTNAVHRALTLVQFAERGDVPSVQQAIDVLAQGTGRSQPEILRDLRQTPPDLVDADQRLQALYTTLQARVDTPDPAGAQEQLQRILSQPRYSGLSAGPSLPEQILGFIVERIADFLSWAGVGNLHLNVPIWLWLGLGLAVVTVILVFVMRGVLSRGGREAQRRADRSPGGPRLDFFADADRLAAGHDYAAAIKALAGAVSVRLKGEQAWERSPFTVRELFQQSDRAEGLRPLLLSFEEASYGHRTPDAAAYARAAEAAAPYRPAAA
ncbi:MAG TPA: hypothetical protein VJO72_07835 [Candidatus Dormibacteraeota bacterium]|nr:hypothetical protein [Candidatus Dormibacteraeota bacterium]